MNPIIKSKKIFIQKSKPINFKRTKKNKTVKSNTPSRNSAIIVSYNRNYYGKEPLPETNIINYINRAYF